MRPRLKLRGPPWRDTEAIGLWRKVKSVYVNPEGESRHRQARAKMARKERESQTLLKKKENGNRQVIRVASEETRDYLREPLNLSREEAEETSFVLSAISLPRGPMFWCDKRCSEKALRFWQF